LLKALPGEPWAVEALDGVYLAPEVLARAQVLAQADGANEAAVVHRDSNGAVLVAGDTVVRVKGLPVKGSSMVAKRGTAVSNIRLVPDNLDQIEGRLWRTAAPHDPTVGGARRHRRWPRDCAPMPARNGTSSMKTPKARAGGRRDQGHHQ